MDALLPGRIRDGSRRGVCRSLLEPRVFAVSPPGSQASGSGWKDRRADEGRFCSGSHCGYLRAAPMIENRSVAVVVPAYRVERQIASLLARMPAYVDSVFVVGDASPDGTAAAVSTVDDRRI